MGDPLSVFRAVADAFDREDWAAVEWRMLAGHDFFDGGAWTVFASPDANVDVSLAEREDGAAG